MVKTLNEVQIARRDNHRPNGRELAGILQSFQKVKFWWFEFIKCLPWHFISTCMFDFKCPFG